MKLTTKRGFTLIELLVVVLIIGILAAIALPQYQKAVFKSRAVQLLTASRTIGRAVLFYKLTHGTLPTAFSELDIEYILPVTWTTSQENPCGNIAPSADAQQGTKDFQLILNMSNGITFAVINSSFTTGPYKCAGFVYVLNNFSTFKEGESYCVELSETRKHWKAVTPAGIFCEKMMRATYKGSYLGWRYYTLP